MKILIIILALIIGGFMLIDGIYVITKGKYIGPPKPGPWAELFYKFDVNVFKLGPLFIIYGIIWIAFLIVVLTNQSWAYMLGIVISIASLWYLPVGTLISIAVLLILILARQKIGV